MAANNEDQAVTLGGAAFTVPRHRFIPRRAWAIPVEGGAGTWIERDSDANRWWETVYSDSAIVTQIDDGATELTEEAVRKTFAYSCSASAPSLVFSSLALLDAPPRQRVLEVGTGTGWTAGLLSALVGAEGVTTIEVDETLAETARQNLAGAGLAPNAIVGDGAKGASEAAPFDRVYVTCGVQDIPYQWVEQTRPGGAVVLPWMAAGRMIRLVVGEDGTASGRFYDRCGFMMLRGQRRQGPGGVADNEQERQLDADPRPLLFPEPGLGLYFAARLGHRPVASVREGTLRGVLSVGLSHARVVHEDGAVARVTQRGPRNLWNEAEAAYREWLALGSPDTDRLGVSVTPEGQHIWLNTPDQPIESNPTYDNER